MYINSMPIAEVIVTPNLIHQYFAGKHAPRRAGQQGQQVEFCWRKGCLSTIDLDTPRRHINGKAWKTQYGVITRRWYIGSAPRLCRFGTADAAQDGSHSTDELTRAKRFHEVVIGAQFKTLNTVVLAAASR